MTRPSAVSEHDATIFWPNGLRGNSPLPAPAGLSDDAPNSCPANCKSTAQAGPCPRG
jgi:hypothetical protein